MRKEQNKHQVEVDKIKENVVKLQKIDKNLIPQYLDNVMKQYDIKPKQIKNGEDNSQLKYML